MRDYPAIIRLTPQWVQGLTTCQAGLPDGRYVPARALPFYTWFGRWRAAWLVFTGKADALIWPGQPEIDAGPPQRWRVLWHKIKLWYWSIDRRHLRKPSH